MNRGHLTNKLCFISRYFILIFAGLFYIKGTKYLTFRQYITNSFNHNAEDVSSCEPPNVHDQLPEELLTLDTIKAKLATNTVKVEAIDIKKETGFDKAQRMLQNNEILNLEL